MAGIQSNPQLLRTFHELCDEAFGLSFRQQHHNDGTVKTEVLDTPFSQSGSSRAWMAAESGRLYPLYPFNQVDAHQFEHSPGTSSPTMSETSTTRVEYEGVEELTPQSGTAVGQRRESWARRSWTVLRRLSNTVIGALPVQLPSMKWTKTETFVELEKWTMDQRNGRGRSPVRRHGRGDSEMTMLTAGFGSIF